MRPSWDADMGSCSFLLQIQGIHVKSFFRTHREAGNCATPISLLICDDAITDVPCFNERLTCVEGRLQAFCQGNEIPGLSVSQAPHESGDRLPVALPAVRLDREHLQRTRGDADRHRE